VTQTAGSALLKRSGYYLAGLAAITLALAVFAYFISTKQVNSVAATLATGRFLLSLDEVLTTVQDAETGQRGYLLTGAETYLSPYIRAKGQVDDRLVALTDIARQAGVEPARLNELRTVVNRKMAELEATVALYQSGRRDAALSLVRANRGQEEMSRIRRLIGALNDEQTGAYARSHERQVLTQKYITAALGLGVGLSILLLISAFRVGAVYVRERDEVEAEIRSLNEELESRVRQRTSELEARTSQLEMQAAELQRSNADLAQFASVASHDLQEPLRMVVSYMGMLSRRYGSSLDETAQTYIQFAVSGASRMQTLIGDLLSYSRAGTQSLSKRQTSFERIVGQVRDNLQVAIRENSAILEHGPLPVLDVDEVKMTQVIQNLVGNAIKFRKPESTPHIEISAKHRGSEWVFSIVDNGIGFDPRYGDRIFQVFQRLHGGGRYPGNGIGLSICKRIVEHHGGRLWAESALGVGSTFFFTLPGGNDGNPKERPT
jgi:signal transduction histidine kinase